MSQSLDPSLSFSGIFLVFNTPLLNLLSSLLDDGLIKLFGSGARGYLFFRRKIATLDFRICILIGGERYDFVQGTTAEISVLCFLSLCTRGDADMGRCTRPSD
jgi:hypothetical protein